MAKRTPERAALAIAIEEKRARDEEIDKLQAALDVANDAVSSSYSEIAAAEKALRNRPQTAAMQMLARGRGGYEEPEPPSTLALRATLAEAESRLADRRAVRDELQKQVDGPIRLHGPVRFDGPGQRVRDAAVAVLRAETGDFTSATAARIHELLLELARLRADLSRLDMFHVFGDLPQDMSADVSSALNPSETDVMRLWQGARASSPWADVLNGLMADADYVLPNGK